MASLAVIAEARLVPDPEASADEFKREFGQMHRGHRTEPDDSGCRRCRFSSSVFSIGNYPAGNFSLRAQR